MSSALLAVALSWAPSACRSAQEVPSTSSNTHWVQACSTDEECGEDLRCYCGLCTAPCEDDSECRDGSVCAPTDEGATSTACEDNGGPQGAAAICVGSCVEGMCTDSLLACQEELCLPSVDPGAGGTSGDGDGDMMSGDGDTAPGDGDMTSGDGDMMMPALGLKQLALGTEFSCALMLAGDVRCWGANGNGQLGVGHTDPLGDEPGEAAIDLPGIELDMQTIVAVAAGQGHACALDSDGRMKCWGANAQGQLGLGDRNDRGDDPDEMGDKLPFIDVGDGLFVAEMALGTAHTCARLTNGAVKCWGEGSVGQLGQGAPDPIGVGPGEMGDDLPPIDLGGPPQSLIAAMSFSTCAVDGDNNLRCWGANNIGQLGQGNTDVVGDDPMEMGTNLFPVELGTASTITNLHAGANHLCVMFADDSPRCFGANSAGQLGNGGVDNIGDADMEMGADLAELAASDMNDWALLSTGRSHTCGLMTNDQVRCWGANVSGQLGQGHADPAGAETSVSAPVTLTASSHTTNSIVAGADRTCIIYDDIYLQCFGRNNTGQLGLGDTMDRFRTDEIGDDLPFVFGP